MITSVPTDSITSKKNTCNLLFINTIVIQCTMRLDNGLVFLKAIVQAVVKAVVLYVGKALFYLFL